jgi:hypothetical protein
MQREARHQEVAMKFLISMADVEDEWDSLPDAEQERIGACHEAFIRVLGSRYIGCWGARPSSEARTVRRHADGTFSVTNGTMTPTKEPLGGFYLIEAESMDEAIGWAKKGRFRAGPNEVRELREG